MTNPVLAKSESFSARPGFQPPQGQAYTQGNQYYTPYDLQQGYTQQQPYAGQPYAPQGYPGQQPYGNPQQPYGQGYPGQPGYAGPQSWQVPPAPPATQKVMTLDDVLTKTALTLGTVVVVAILAIWATSNLGLTQASFYTIGLVCGIATIIFPFVAAARRKVGPVLAITFAVLEGVFIGAISLLFETVYEGIIFQAVLSTFVAAALTLAAFHFGKFRLTTRMRKIVMISVIAYAGVALLNLVLYLFGINLGLFPGPYQTAGIWAWVAAGVGVVLAVLSLVDDFQYVEQGIANRAPATESWRAAYGLTVTMVWLYVNLLRILSYIRR